MNPSSGIFSRVLKAFGSFGVSAFFQLATESIKNGGPHIASMALGPVAWPVCAILGEIFSHFGVKLTDHISDDVLERIGKNPMELNHHLQGLFAEAVKQAIEEGIPITYQKEKGIQLEKSSYAKLKELSKQFEYAFEISSNKPLSSSELIKYLDEKRPADYLDLFKTENRVGPAYYPDKYFLVNKFPDKFNAYFKENFLHIVRILFIEGLKSKEYEKARIAYEQMMAEETYRGLSEIKDEISKLKKSGKYAESKYSMISEQEFSISLEKIKSSEKIQLLLHNGLNQYFQHFDQKLDELLEIAKDTSIQVSHINVKTDRIEKGMTRNIIISFVLLTAVVLASCIYGYVYFTKGIFDFRFLVFDGKGRPVKNGLMYLNFKKGGHILGKISDEGIATFEKIESKYFEDTAEITLYKGLEDKYRIADSCKLIPIVINETRRIVLIEDSVIIKNEKQIGLPEKENVIITKNEKKIPVAEKENLINTNHLEKFLCDIEGSNFKDELSESNHITFHSKKGNTIGFTGFLEIEGVNGDMTISANSMYVKTGNVFGTLSMNNNCKTIIGMLTLKSNGANININYKKAE